METREIPFIVGRPVTGAYFVGREDELNRLCRLVGGVEKGAFSNCILMGLRRTGKTSVLVNLEAQLRPNPKIMPCMVNCHGIASKSQFAKLLIDRAVESYVQKTGDKAFFERLSKTVGKVVHQAFDRLSELQFSELALKFRDKDTNEETLIEDAMNYLESLAEDKQVFFVVMLDEFQDVIGWGENTLKRMRSVVQSQKRVCYVLAGSATSIMRELVYDRRSPFYRQLVEVPIGKLEKEAIETFLKQRFSLVKMQATDAVIEKIASLSDGYPDYAQRLGLELYLSVGYGNRITLEDVENVYGNMVLSLDGEFEAYFACFSPLEREILTVLAAGKIQPSEVAREVRKTIFNISRSLTRLLNFEVVERPMKGHYRIMDPVFADWLRKRFVISEG